VIVGGMLLSPICSLMVIPIFARLFMARDARVRDQAVPGHAEAASAAQ